MPRTRSFRIARAPMGRPARAEIRGISGGRFAIAAAASPRHQGDVGATMWPATISARSESTMAFAASGMSARLRAS